MFMCNRIWIWYMFSHMWILSTSGMLWTEKLYFFPWLMMARMVNSLGVLTLNTYSLWGFDSYQNHFSRNFSPLFPVRGENGNRKWICLSVLFAEGGRRWQLVKEKLLFHINLIHGSHLILLRVSIFAFSSPFLCSSYRCMLAHTQHPCFFFAECLKKIPHPLIFVYQAVSPLRFSSSSSTSKLVAA